MRLEILREGAHLGTRVLTDFEIVTASGGIQQFTEAAGHHVITLTSMVNNALISGIEID